MKKVTIIGGGTGTFVVTQALRQLDLDVTKIVAVFDSGGSTARLRDEFGFLPVGDLRQSLAALAKENGQSWIRQLLLYRFSKGNGLEGHNLGNLILTALQDLTGSTPKALEIATKIFRLQGQIYPITTTEADLKITYQNGKVEIGEHKLDQAKNGGRKITKLELTKPCSIYSKAKDAILDSDFIIIGPGDLYASILPNFVVSGTNQALKKSPAKIIYIVNLMTRYTQTHDLSAKDHLELIGSYVNTNIDYVIVNTGTITPKIAAKYASQKEFPVKLDLKGKTKAQIITGDFASSVEAKSQKGDKIASSRSLMRHDQNKLAKALEKIIG